MKDIVYGIKYEASKVFSWAVGASKLFCMGYMTSGGGEATVSNWEEKLKLEELILFE